jgi:acetylornithine deacetylase/succinyl-diaminopimelate desuccinylase-like protein
MTVMTPNSETLIEYIDQQWTDSVLPELIDYIRIPNKSPAFDPQWQENGYMDQVVEQFVNWCNKQAVRGMQLEVVRLEGRTPLIFMDIAGDSDDVVLLYGHLDKQPEMTG